MSSSDLGPTIEAAVVLPLPPQFTKQKRTLKQKICKFTLLLVSVLTLFALVFLASVSFSNYNQCDRTCKLKFCSSADCFLSKMASKRSVRKCTCSNGAVLNRKLERVNTTAIDAALVEYCVCNSVECATVQTNSAPNVFLHKGPCGHCSNPADFQIYKETALTLTKSSTKAAVASIFSKQKAINQMTKIGLSDKCSECWVGNMQNTLVHCFWTCAFGSRASCENGHLSKCLQCDEDYSGKYFRDCAGMTRRRAGITSDICRQNGEIVDK
ncbi:Conserved_hypothetical protein [Hexamita inflata]|uniref:Uncharacterized protein n=1 Tax=Hexamita inflata TaxID=28002 RepID=A0AA86QS73_9EUKA|nr:Conserved hypothetical protein [Hexamita inflata]